MKKSQILKGSLIALILSISLQSFSQITGLTFEDYNASGTQDTGEPGIPGIIINAYRDNDALNAPSYSGISDAAGNYALVGLNASEEVRLEFIIPAPLNYLRQGAAGNSSVVFATNGTSGINVGFNNPNNYSTVNPLLVTPCYVVGEHDDNNLGGLRDALVGIFYDWGGAPLNNSDDDDQIDENGNDIGAIHYAVNAEIGTTNGIAWDRTTNRLYLAAYQKKHTDFGPGGPGAIYTLEIDPISGLPQSSATLFADVDSYAGISVCGSHGNDLNPASDPGTADSVGKCALGDLDISDDNSKLYTVNLQGKEIIEIDIATGNMSNSWNFPTLSQTGCYSCANPADVRPFGLKFRNGKLYVAGHCSSEITQDDQEINSFIYELDPATGVFTEFYCFAWYGGALDHGNNRPWQDGNFQETANPSSVGWRNYIFTDIEFYGNDLIMGFRDRQGDMRGANVPGVSNDAQARGEIITAWFNTTTGQYVLESPSDGSAGPFRPGSGIEQGNEGDNEFYVGDGPNQVNGTGNVGAKHYDQCFGGLAQINTQDVVMTALTPRQPFNIAQTGSGGFNWLNNVNGQAEKSFTLYQSGDAEVGATLSKANGLGDVEGLTSPAPIEIGDYVWIDTDGDGVQDPGEAPIGGITVELYKDGNPVASTTTDGAGRYYFSSVNNPVTSGGQYSEAYDTGDNTANNYAMQRGTNFEIESYNRNDRFRDWGALRFTGLDIPQGATITTAYIQYLTDRDSQLPNSDPAEVAFYAEDVDNSPVFSVANGDLSARSVNLTSASANWTIPAEIIPEVWSLNHRSPDLSALVQEVVNRSGWQAGNALSIFNEMNVNGNDGQRGARGRYLVVEWNNADPQAGAYQQAVLPNMNYEVRLALNQAQITGPGYSITTRNSSAAGSETGNNAASDIRDNDAEEQTGNAVIAFSTGDWGENNHGLDFGFRSGSMPCVLNAAGLSSETCNNNSTPGDSTDDYITFSLAPTGTNLGTTYSLSVNNSASITLAGGGAATGVNYADNPTAFRLHNGSSNGSPYTVTITDDADSSCQITTTLQQNTCSSPPLLFSLGNRVFYDDNNNGIQDAGENGIDGIILQLLNADGSVYDHEPSTPGVQILSVATDNGGYYRFDELPADSYIVEITAANTGSGGSLENYISSTGDGQEINPNNDGDLNDNGTDSSLAGEVRSGIVTLGLAEPTGEEEPSSYSSGSFTGTAAVDNQSNLTVDFGFYRERDRPDCCDPNRPPCSEEPCHFISNQIYFGSGVTGDSGSLNSGTADADADDGVLLNESMQITPGGVLRLPMVFYNNTGADAYIRAWVDFNGDGDFDDSGEQVADLIYPAASYTGSFTELVNINTPADILQNSNLPMRWRISTDDLNTSGPCGTGTCADDGEIEDYLLRASCPTKICTSVSLSIISN